MKLQLLITQYEETEDLIRPMLKSIELQQGVDLKKDIGVLIGNDGSLVKLSEDFLDSFSYPINYRHYEHSGLPGCRQNLLADSTAQYVMFCDADDVFLLATGLHTILSYIEKGFDAFTSKFYEEVIAKNGKAVYIPHDRDRVFVHGKVYRRQFLLDNKIVWHPELRYQEDACFNNLALIMSRQTVYCEQAFYLWRFRADSMCRSVCMNDPLHMLRAFPGTVDADEQLLTDLKDRGRKEEAVYLSNQLLFQWYFMMQKPEWLRKENTEYRDLGKRRIRAFFWKYKELIDAASSKIRDKAYRSIRNQVEGSQVICADITFKGWLKEILDGGSADTQNAVKIAMSETTQRFQAVTDIKKSGRLDFDKRKVKTIAAYCTRMANGGTERVISILSGLWSSMGYNVILLTDDTGTDGDYALPPNVKRITIHEYKGFTEKDLRERAEILKCIMLENQIDLVVYNAEFSPLLLLDELVVKNCGAAFVIYCHSMFTFPLKVNTPDFMGLTVPYLLADAVVTLNDMNRDFWSRFNENVFSINNPLVEQPEQWKLSPCSNHKILFIGRLSQEKRPFDALRVWGLVSKIIPDAELHIVGKSEDGQVEGALRKIIKDRGLEGKVFLHGYFSDVKPFYQDASVLLVTSELEGYSLTIQESMLSGLPCVSYAMPYLTLSRVNRGMISVGQGDVVAAANAVIGLFKDDRKRKAMGTLARESIKALVSYDVKGAWESIFQSIYKNASDGEEEE